MARTEQRAHGVAQPITYRELLRHELAELRRIDRSERIDGVFKLHSGALELTKQTINVSSWDPRELAEYVARLEKLFDGGGLVFGAFLCGELVGLGSLDFTPVGGDETLSKLDMLYVSAPHRKRGIARVLTGMVAAAARARGSRKLYISATPTRRTVEFYLSLGAKLCAEPDPKLFAMEPADIHLLLELKT